jgi:PAS domain S-box-containing protein
MLDDDLRTLMTDPPLLDAALSAVPVVVWASDGRARLYANTAAGGLGATAPDGASPFADQIRRLVATLAPGGPGRLERFRLPGFGSSPLVTCIVERRRLPGGRDVVVAKGMAPAGPALPAAARARALADLIPGTEAILSADGTPLIAPDGAGLDSTFLTPSLRASLEASGEAETEAPAGRFRLTRIGRGAAALVAVKRLAEARVPEAVSPADASEHPDGPAVADVPVATPDNMPPDPPGPDAAAPAEETDTAPSLANPTVVVDEPVAVAETAGAGLAGSIEPASDMVVADPIMAAVDAPAPVATDSPSTAVPDESPQPDVDIVPMVADTPVDPMLLPAPRRQPLRFIWRTDGEGRLTDLSPDLTKLTGPPVATAIGENLAGLAARLGLDPQNRLAGLLAGRNTWSGVSLALPVAGSDEPLIAELSGLPAFARDRGFDGYRGFGICRDVDRLTAIDRLRAHPAVPASVPASADVELPAPAEAAEPAGEPARPEPVRPGRPNLTVLTTPPNVVALRTATAPADPRRPTLSPVDRSTFEEIARMLGAKVTGALPEPPAAMAGAMASKPAAPEPVREASPPAPIEPVAIPSAFAPFAPPAPRTADAPALTLIDRMPVGVLIYRGETVLHANRTLLDWTGHADLAALDAAGGLAGLIDGQAIGDDDARPMMLATASGDPVAVDARLYATPWADGTAFALVMSRAMPVPVARIAPLADADLPLPDPAPATDPVPVDAPREPDPSETLAAELAMWRDRAFAAESAARETASVLDIATDGVLVVDAEARIVRANRSAEALFGYNGEDLVGRSLYDLIAPESHRLAVDYLEGLTRNGVASLLNDGREVVGRVRGGGTIPLFLNMGRVEGSNDKLCAVLRDITPWKDAERDLTSAKAQAERASSAKSDFLAKISHEIRTPLNAIIGFSEVMMEERFGPVANERYRDYLQDIHTSGSHVISLVNDLLDLSKIEAGKLDLSFTSVHLNDLVQQCVAIMQPQASRGRIIIRPSLVPGLPPVVADARSIRQIVLNLLSNSIKFTPPGGQVIVTTLTTEAGEVALRVRDTGVGMDEKDIATAMEPFRQLATTARTGGGTGLGLPLTKALAEANRADFSIKSAPNSGTLVEVRFPVTRVLAE